MKFSVKSIFVVMSVVCVFLSLNFVPWRLKRAVYADGGRSFRYEVDAYGWPYSYVYHYPDTLPGDLTHWGAIERNRMWHAFDDAVICTILAVFSSYLIIRFTRSPPVNESR